jgi:hypothetical protein
MLNDDALNAVMEYLPICTLVLFLCTSKRHHHLAEAVLKRLLGARIFVGQTRMVGFSDDQLKAKVCYPRVNPPLWRALPSNEWGFNFLEVLGQVYNVPVATMLSVPPLIIDRYTETTNTWKSLVNTVLKTRTVIMAGVDGACIIIITGFTASDYAHCAWHVKVVNMITGLWEPSVPKIKGIVRQNDHANPFQLVACQGLFYIITPDHECMVYDRAWIKVKSYLYDRTCPMGDRSLVNKCDTMIACLNNNMWFHTLDDMAEAWFEQYAEFRDHVFGQQASWIMHRDHTGIAVVHIGATRDYELAYYDHVAVESYHKPTAQSTSIDMPADMYIPSVVDTWPSQGLCQTFIPMSLLYQHKDNVQGPH